MQFLSLVLILLLSSNCGSGSDITLQGDNVCYIQEVVVLPVNTSYSVPITETKWEFCFSWTFKCAREEIHLEKKLKTENVTRVTNVAACCPGFQEDIGKCIPTCEPPCSHGHCSAPFTCSCEPGYSGAQCQEKGCPGGRWGDGCKKECTCKNRGHCNAVNGTCSCSAGYNGVLCQHECLKGTFGENCSKECNCSRGFSCHHISGECLRCSNETFGDQCEEACDCYENGTALCSHVDGRCFCEANWFGDKCHLHCPFGFDGDQCIPSVENQTCTCPSDLFHCDPQLGCVCPQGKDCGIEQRHQDQVMVGQLQEGQSSTGLIALVVVILVVGVLISGLVVVYYRRRLKVMKKDLASRSGHSNSGLDDDDIFTPEPLTPISQLHIPQFPSVENNQISFTRPTETAHNPTYIINYSRPEKNVNITRDNIVDTEDIYHEPEEVKKNLKNKFDINNATDEDDTYDHIYPKKMTNPNVKNLPDRK